MEGMAESRCPELTVTDIQHTYIHKYIHTYIHIYIHTYIHTCIHTYIHTYIRIYKRETATHHDYLPHLWLNNDCINLLMIATSNLNNMDEKLEAW